VVVVEAAAGLASFSFLGGAAALDAVADLLASFTVPEAPFGRRKSPDFSPLRSAVLMWFCTPDSVMLPSLLFALMYFVMA